MSFKESAASPLRHPDPAAIEVNPFTSPYIEEPEPIHARLRSEAPVCFNPLLGLWLVSRYDDICAVLKDPERFSSVDTSRSTNVPTPEALEILSKGYPMVPTALDSDPPFHSRVRRLMGRGFTPSRVAAQEPRIRRIANQLIDQFIDHGSVDIVKQFTFPLPALVIIEMMGFPPEDLQKIRDWCDDLFGFLFMKVSPERQLEMARSIVAYQHYCADFIDQRRKAPQDDLTSNLVVAEEDGETLTLPELILVVGGALIAAGHETTAHMLSRCVRLLLTVPERWRTLKNDPSLIPAYLEESMRCDPAAHGMVRTTTEDVDLAGVKLPKGARLFLLYASANRDPSRFPNPLEFDPSRDNRQHLGFGRGIHYCLGAPLARLEARLALEALLTRLPEPRLIPEPDSGYLPNLTLRGLQHLNLTWTPRAHT